MAWRRCLWLASSLGVVAANGDIALGDQLRSAERQRSDAVAAAVQPVLDAMALKWNMSFSFGFTDGEGSVGLAAGYDDIWANPKTLLTPQTQIPLGSATKPWTAIRVLQFMEAGKISLEDLASKWVDPLLDRLHQTSLVGIFGDSAAPVTIRDLLGMTSGFSDYADEAMEFITLLRSGDDVDPIVYLRSAAKQGKVCDPGACGFYSGANYVLLGYVLVELEGLWQWQDLDQRDVIPTSLRRHFQHTSFLALGRCAQYSGIAHQFAEVNNLTPPHPRPHPPHPHGHPFHPDPPFGPPGKRANVTQVDLLWDSCLNGWTMGNIASTGQDVATFYYDIFALAATGGGFVNSSTVDLMQHDLKPLTNDWCPGCNYGLGLMNNMSGQDVWLLKNSSADMKEVALIGHLGADWGSGTWPCGYNKAHDFGICFAFNSLGGMNCTLTNTSAYAIYEATCLGYDAALSVVGGPRLDCRIPEDVKPKDEATCEWIERDPDNFRPHGPGPNGPQPEATVNGDRPPRPATTTVVSPSKDLFV